MVEQELFAGCSLLTALPKVSARMWLDPICPIATLVLRATKDGEMSLPYRGDVSGGIQATSDMGTVPRKRYKHPQAPRKVEVAQLLEQP